MKFHLFITLAFLVSAITYCHCLDTEDDLPADYLFASNEVDAEDEYIVEAFKSISKTLKNRISVLVGRAIQTTAELKKVLGDGGEDFRSHLKELWRELAQSRDQLKQKLRELFVPSQYSDQSRLRHFEPVRVKLQRVLGQLKEGSELKRLREILRDVYEEIKSKIFQYRKSRPAQYSQDLASFETPYIIKTLKELRATIKGKLAELFDKIKAKSAEVKRTLGDRAKEVKEQLKALREQLASTREAVRSKVQEIFKPSRYAAGDFVQETLRPLHAKLEKFIKDTKEVTEENVDQLKKTLCELRSEIKRVVTALRGNKPVAYAAEEDVTQGVLAFEQLSTVLHNELLDIIAKLESLESDETPNQEAVDEQLRRLDELEKNVRAMQQLSEPAKYYLTPVLEKLNKIFAVSSVKLLDFFNKVTKAAKVMKEGVVRASNHTKHSFGKIKDIVARGRDQVHQHIRDALRPQGDTTTTGTTDTFNTTDDVQEGYTTTPAVPDVDESRSTTFESGSTTDTSYDESRSTTFESGSPTDTSYDESRSTTFKSGSTADISYPNFGDPMEYDGA